MKKLLYVALAAMMLISCDPNAPKIPSKDNKMMDNLSKNVLSLLGQKKKDVKAAVESYGFEDVTDLATKPARLLAKEAESFDLVYFYGNLDIYEEAMEEEDAFEVLVDYLLEKNEIIALLALDFDDSNKLDFGMVTVYTPSEIKNIKNLYLNFSKNLFLSLEKGKEWSAQLLDLDDYPPTGPDSFKEYAYAKKRDKFEADFEEIEFAFAMENGADDFDKSTTRNYSTQWIGDLSVMDDEMDGLAGFNFSFSLNQVEPEP